MSESRLVKHSARTVRKPCSKCGSTDLYWGHDPSSPVSGQMCREVSCAGHGHTWKWVLVNRDLTLHQCGGQVREHVLEEASEREPELAASIPVGAAEPPAAPVVAGDTAAALAALLQSLTPSVDVSEQLDAFRVEMLARMDALSVPVTVVVSRPELGELRPVRGTCHRVMPKVLACLSVGEHVYLTGTAGVGKTTIAEQCAEALGVPYFGMSLSPQTPTSAVFGYMQATGDYVRTPYREAFEHGGVFLLDEIDTAHPAVLAGVNMSLANGQGAFPDGMVKRHPDFRCVAAGNTVGRGADRTYVGRQALDGATLDRFTVLNVAVDEALEASLCAATGLAAEQVGTVLELVRGVRANVERHQMSAPVVGPRASVGICRLLTSGEFTLSEAVDARLRKGLSDQDWVKATEGVRL